MNKIHGLAKANLEINQERINYNLYLKDVLYKDFPQVLKWMDGKQIEAFTSASVPQSTLNKVEQITSDGIKNIALATIGIKLIRVETECFWILSGSDLHFISTNTNGELDKHLIFGEYRLSAATIKYDGVLKTQLGIYSNSTEEYLPKIHLITFYIEGTPLTLEIHDRLHLVNDTKLFLNIEQQLSTRIKYKVLGEKFLTILGQKFLNLNVN